MSSSMWYNKRDLMSYNGYFNMIVGQRGCGKTFAFKEWVIYDFLKNGNKAVWVRRYERELRGTSKENSVFYNFLKDLHYSEQLKKIGYDETKFKIKKDNLIYNENDKEITVVKFIALSTADKKKSVVFDEKINKVIYDEFIIRENMAMRYLKNEVEIFLDLLETVDRHRNNIRAFLIGNAYSKFNPYFNFFNVKLEDKRFYQNVSRGIVVEQYENKVYSNMKLETNIGRLIAGTNYSGYSIKNIYRQDNTEFIKPLDTTKMRYIASLRYNDILYGYWHDYEENRGYISTKVKSNFTVYALNEDSHKDGSILLEKAYTHYIYRSLREFYKLGLLFFETEQCKFIMRDFLGLI